MLLKEWNYSELVKKVKKLGAQRNVVFYLYQRDRFADDGEWLGYELALVVLPEGMIPLKELREHYEYEAMLELAEFKPEDAEWLIQELRERLTETE